MNNSGRFTKGMIPWNKDKKGLHLSPNSQFKKGIAPWNKGIKWAEMSGKNHWNWKGATICECGNPKSAPAKNCWPCAAKKISIRMIGNTHGKGHRHSDTAKKLMAIARIKNPTSKNKDTKIEKIIESLLIGARIAFLKQVAICGVTIADFYLEDSNIAIFADGCYWHGCGEHRSILDSVELNKNQNKTLMKNGVSVLRFWEHEINSDPQTCIRKIIELINLKSRIYGE